ncbi:hypothetical protein H8A99_23015 [Bradyrhizobium sp. Arg68]|uniref:hypothetical protein n=1 Tax=Bradyrhizobium ivorense TaxID=2511166 RepID=UPI001E2D14A4|nr:hypothetical protein [Bradyrhizobium ivorense]MCC8939265.1 hypothetical protein [Bradyrhizobium ivorense]
MSERVTPEAVADVCEHVGGIKRYSGLVGCLDELSLAQPAFKVTRLDIMAALADNAIYPAPVLRIVSSVALRTAVQDLIYSDMLETQEPMGNA